MIRLRQTTGADAGRVLEFEQDLVRIGRMPDSDVNFDPEVDLDASGRHAEIRSEDGRYLVIDTGSRNGTWLNGQRIKHAALRDGDEVEFGRGGPKLLVAAVRAPTPRPRSIAQPSTDTPQRDPRFDPLAMPVTTATRLKDLPIPTGSSQVPKRPPAPEDTSSEPPPEQGHNTVLWWTAGALALAAIWMFVATVFQ